MVAFSPMAQEFRGSNFAYTFIFLLLFIVCLFVCNKKNVDIKYIFLFNIFLFKINFIS